MEVLRVSEAKSENRMPGIVEVGVLAISTLANHSSSSAPARNTCDQITVGWDISGCKEGIMSTMKELPKEPKELTDSQFESYTKTLKNNVEELIKRTHKFGDYCFRTARLREREEAYLETLEIIKEMWRVLEKGNIIANYAWKHVVKDEEADKKEIKPAHKATYEETRAMYNLAHEVQDFLLKKTISHLQEMVGSLGDTGWPEKVKDKKDEFKKELPRTAGLINGKRLEEQKNLIFSLDYSINLIPEDPEDRSDSQSDDCTEIRQDSIWKRRLERLIGQRNSRRG